MERTAMEATASSSDCQFCRVRFQKSAEVGQAAQVVRAASCRARCNAATPVIDWAEQEDVLEV
jgi:hypothetical protein